MRSPLVLIPDIKAQDQAIAEMVARLRRVHDWWTEVEPDRERIRIGILGLMLAHGRPCYMGERTFTGRRARAKQCYMNAYSLVADDHCLTYVEGWCDDLEHAWCIDSDGQVIDPTLREAKGYFGIPFRWEYVCRTASRTGYYGVIYCPNSDFVKTPVETFLHTHNSVET